MRGDRFHGLRAHGLSYPIGATLAAGAGVVFGPLAIGALVVGLGAAMLDIHSHRCDACDHTWTHAGRFNQGNESGHTCARCGRVQWWRVGEVGAADVDAAGCFARRSMP